MTTRNREIRLQIMLDGSEVAALEDWRFKKRMPSRAAAVRELIRRGLAAEGFELADGQHKSSEYGVVSTPDADELSNGKWNGKANGSRPRRYP
jgi:hypothetical protein